MSPARSAACAAIHSPARSGRRAQRRVARPDVEAPPARDLGSLRNPLAGIDSAHAIRVGPPMRAPPADERRVRPVGRRPLDRRHDGRGFRADGLARLRIEQPQVEVHSEPPEDAPLAAHRAGHPQAPLIARQVAGVDGSRSVDRRRHLRDHPAAPERLGALPRDLPRVPLANAGATGRPIGAGPDARREAVHLVEEHAPHRTARHARGRLGTDERDGAAGKRLARRGVRAAG